MKRRQVVQRTNNDGMDLVIGVVLLTAGILAILVLVAGLAVGIGTAVHFGLL